MRGGTGVFLCLTGKKVCFWFREKKKVCTEEKKTIASSHLSSGPALYSFSPYYILYTTTIVSQLFARFELKSKCELRDGHNQFARRVRTKSASNFSCDIALTLLLRSTSISLLLLS